MKDCKNKEHSKPCSWEEYCDVCGISSCTANYGYHVCIPKKKVRIDSNNKVMEGLSKEMVHFIQQHGNDTSLCIDFVRYEFYLRFNVKPEKEQIEPSDEIVKMRYPNLWRFLKGKKLWTCPICNTKTTDYGALSRKDNKTKICDSCGQKEALTDFVEAMEVE